VNFSFDVFWTYLFDQRMAQAAMVTVVIATLAQGLATIIGFFVALGMLQRPPLSVISRGYIWVFRGVPPLVLLLMFYFGLPQLGLKLSVFQAGLLGLSLYAGGYMAEIIRSGLLSVDRGQAEAARSLGFSRAETLRSIVLPQAVRVILPPFGNEYSSMLRTTSLLSVISFEELLRVTTLAINQTFRAIELYSVAAIYYLVLTTGWMLIQRQLERVAARGRRRNANALSTPTP
jgi:polar amino acid transport system permease protein